MARTGSMSRADVAALVCRLRLNGYKVQELQMGFACEVEGTQLFSACDQGNERYSVKINEGVFPDV